ncbi:ABC-type antimicrobial peptide transport system, ATPase component [hydrothermal vent metagenome]|uniref:ABC-type antimicrobial peptide transport system, ATPase component n=1 Tax=hydrothermal vent metagenome TaxID=652676 RepID=A0A3B0YIS0_9ZZZZ
MPEPIIYTSSLGKQVKSSAETLTILDNITLEIKPGETVAIVGESGSGKSTLLGLLAGLDQASSGTVNLLGENLNTLNEDGRALLRAGRVGFVFQSFQLLAGLSALENVMLPLELGKHSQCREQASQLLTSIGLGHRLSHLPGQLSGGEQQRVAVARAYATNPDILFADEPTGNLDQKTGHQIIDLLFEFNQKQHTTLVLVTHDEQLSKRCDTVFRLSEGKLLT